MKFEFMSWKPYTCSESKQNFEPKTSWPSLGLNSRYPGNWFRRAVPLWLSLGRPCSGACPVPAAGTSAMPAACCRGLQCGTSCMLAATGQMPQGSWPTHSNRPKPQQRWEQLCSGAMRQPGSEAKAEAGSICKSDFSPFRIQRGFSRPDAHRVGTGPARSRTVGGCPPPLPGHAPARAAEPAGSAGWDACLLSTRRSDKIIPAREHLYFCHFSIF